MIRLYNTLTKKIDDFKPLKTDFVRQYDCGPTVYFYAHIGNMWRYVISDLLRRVLEYNGYQVKQVMNITDVGHLTEDDLAADTGEDKMELAAKKEKKTPQQIAEFYTQVFLKDMERLNILRPHIMPKATEHIASMIRTIEVLEKKGYAYWAGDKYFVYDISKFKNYGKLSGKKLDELKVGSRLEPVPGKRNPFDFALWIKDSKHLMHWDSPWGVGYPGWHIECSAMSMEYLGPTLDIHTGGEDNIFPHHENEIAQSEAATGKQFVRYWVHIRHNFVNGQKMSKSQGNIYTLQDLVDKGFDPLAYRYLCLGTHYRKNLNFTWNSLESAAKALDKLKEMVKGFYQKQKKRTSLGEECLLKVEKYKESFRQAVNNDLGLSEALAVVWEMVKSDMPTYDKLDLILDFDKVLGLDLERVSREEKVPRVSREVKDLVKKREELRGQGNWEEADKLRKQIEKLGWEIEDTPKGTKLK
ncbi:cysteine--tRNA ligase [Patescibacteria group bacterium]|nr:cysteine--tRNA ligase [Patescibacteria group bacterium]